MCKSPLLLLDRLHHTAMRTTRRKGRDVTGRLCRAVTGRRASAMKAAAAVLIVADVAVWCTPSGAQTALDTEWGLEEIEKAFWVCDHAASIGLLDMGSAIVCSRLTEALKQRKFDGNFQALLAWWQQHREAEHQALARAGGASLPRPVPPAR
jgi:hypothetical protein